MAKKSICESYWEFVVEDYISCCSDDMSLDSKQKKEVINRLLNDDEMWSQIDQCISYHINKVKGGEK